MSKMVFAMVIGAILGALDGLSAYVSEPGVRPVILQIVAGSTFKGVVTGVLIALFERQVKSLALGVLFGLAVGFALAYLITLGNPPSYFWKIMLPGGLVGLIVGYATYRHQAPRPA
jgi:peptidoglycan/LPS O-acetylase OafA/YrhL